jgi:hypothetical protein
MNKILNLVLAISIFLSTSANANVSEGLATAFNEYYYSLTVEWDQKDPAFKKALEDDMALRLLELNEQGMTQEDVLNFLDSRPHSKIFADNLRELLSHTKLNLMSKKEALGMFNQIANQSYQRGANWLGMNDGFNIFFILIGALALTTLGLWATGVVNCEQERYCWNQFDCESRFVCE